MKKVGKYLRELSIVVAGVAITLYAGSYLNRKSEQRSLQQFLNAVKFEMKENLVSINDQCDFFQESYDTYKFIKSFREKGANMDSLAAFVPTIYSYRMYGYKYDAFESLKASGYMRLIKDETLLSTITESYGITKSVEQISLFYFNQKLEILNRIQMAQSIDEYYDRPNLARLYSPKQKELFLFMGNSMIVGFKEVADECKSKVEEAISKLDAQAK